MRSRPARFWRRSSGAALAAAGASYQALFRNPLVSPDILGVSAGAGLVRNTDRTLTLVGVVVVVGALAGAATSLLKVLADPHDQLPAITFWLLGSLASVTSADIGPALPAVMLGLVPLVLLRWRINALSLGDEEARALGVEAGRTRFVVIAAATLITASVTALAGVVGWVGLVIPHIARR
jgi:iron complex transport system permease protein